MVADLKVVSRDELFNERNEEPEAEDSVILPKLEFEFIEVNNAEGSTADIDRNTENVDTNNTQEDDEFDFPLFSFGAAAPLDEADNGKAQEEKEEGESRGRSVTKLMKVSLREPSPEVINITRPRLYYFSEYSEAEKQQFRESALDVDSILKEYKLGPYKGWPEYRGKVIDLNEHNAKIDLEQQRMKKLQKKRPSKKQRIARKLGKERELQRIQKDKEIKMMIKKRFHKRGGKKNKKKVPNPLENAGATPKNKPKTSTNSKPKSAPKPKFRTE